MTTRQSSSFTIPSLKSLRSGTSVRAVVKEEEIVASPSKVKLEEAEKQEEGADASGQASESPSPSNKKRKRKSKSYDDPKASKYAHLSGVPDWLADDLDLLLCGINPGVESARSSHHYAHHSNHFYKALAQSGITSRLYSPTEDATFPTLLPFSIGLTNLAHRPTSQASELGEDELHAGAPLLLEKVRRCRPKVVGFVGKGIAQAFSKAVAPDSRSSSSSPRKGGYSAAALPTIELIIPKDTPLAWEDSGKGYGLLQVCCKLETDKKAQTSLDGAHDVALFWSCPSTSARVTSLQLPGKVEWFKKLRNLVEHLQAVGNERSGTNSEHTPKIKVEEHPAGEMIPAPACEPNILEGVTNNPPMKVIQLHVL